MFKYWSVILFVISIFGVLPVTGDQAWAVNIIDVSQENGSILLTPKHGGDGSAWGLKECDTCHVMNQLHERVDVIRGLVRQKGFDTCSGCHGSNGVDHVIRRCNICHNPTDLAVSPAQIGKKNHSFTVEQIQKMPDEDCITCHEASDMDGQFEPGIDLTLLPNAQQLKAPFRYISEFCLTCHNRDHQLPDSPITGLDYRHPLIAMEDNFNFIDMHGKPRGSGERTYAGLREGYQYGTIVECTDCHAMHGTHNAKLIIDSTDIGASRLTPDIRNLPISIHVNNGDYSQLCVSCHSMESIVDDGDINTGNGLSGVHELGTDCRECHTHGRAVQVGL